MINPDGSVTTVFTRGVVVGDKVYNLPAYDRENQRIMTEAEQISMFWPFIRDGQVQGYPREWNGPRELHPANVAARKEHELIEADMKAWREKHPNRFKGR